MDQAIVGAYSLIRVEVETYLRARSGLPVAPSDPQRQPAASPAGSNVREISSWSELRAFAPRRKPRKP